MLIHRTTDTPHYENVPKGWVLTDIGELLTNRDSERVPLSLGVRSKQENKIYDYYGATGVVDKVDGYLFDERLLLIGEDGANLLSRSKDNAFFAEGKYWVNNHAHILDCPEKNVLDYVAFLINSMSLEDYITGSAQPKLNQDNLNKIEIPLPPLEEQRRIIAQVNLWLSYIKELEISETELQDSVELAKSKILDLAIHGKLVHQDPNDEPASELLKRINPKAVVSCDNPHYPVPYQIPSNWIWCHLKSICTKIVDGDHNPPVGSAKETPYRMLSSKNINNNSFVDINNCRFLTYEDWVICNSRTKLTKGDILLTTVATLGRSCVNDSEIPYCFQRSVTVITTTINNYYLKFLFDSPYYQTLMNDSAKGTAQKGFYLNQMEQSLIPIPPLSEQFRIVSKVNELFSQLDMIEKSLQA